MKLKIVGSLFSAVILVASCGSAEFFGSSSGSKNSDQPPPATSTPINTPGSGTSSGGSNDPHNPGVNNNPVGSTTPGGPGVPGAPGYNPIPGGSNYPGSVPGAGGTNCPNSPCSPGQNPTWGPNGEIETTPNSVTFGKDHVFHIGNGKFSASTCREEISMLPLQGSIYFFQFEVTADATTLSVNIAKACGIDYGSGTVQLAAKAGVEVLAQPLVAGSTSLGLPAKTLNKGVYTIYVYAGKGDGVKGPAWDIDDFIVGKVNVTGDKPIKAGRFGTYR